MILVAVRGISVVCGRFKTWFGEEHWMRSTAVLMTSAFIAVSACVSTASHAATAAQVQAAIEKATKYVYTMEKENNWEAVPARDSRAATSSVRGAQWGGLTALSTYALLAAGESPQDPRIAKAVEFLRTADLVGTYAVGLRAQVWLNIPKNDLIRDAIAKDAKLLLLSRRTAEPNPGEFGYMNQGPSVTTDHSNSQYGVLGLWACSDAVEGIPDAFWISADSSWRKSQGVDGSWAYRGRPGDVDTKGKVNPDSATMTAAGIATLFITQDFLFRERGLECSGNIQDKNIDAGLKWMAGHFPLALSGAWPFYGLYGVERIGVASGYKYFGDVDWYERGADFLVSHQNAKDGSFPPADPRNLGAQGSLVNTCFALLFLSRGRAPVMMNKLDYQIATQEANWNERPRDIANLARWVGKETENDLNWQVSTMASPVNDWHDAPILYISGNQALSFTPAEQAKLKAFVEEGGLILGSADCGNRAFADSFRKLGSKLFDSYEFAPIGPTDIIMHDEQFNAAKWRRKPTLLGLYNGARELMLLIPDADPAKAWQMEETTGKEELFQLADNLYLYSIDKDEMSVKGDSYIVEPNKGVKPLHSIDVARIEYEGNWDPEPGGWRRLNAVMHNGDSLDVKVTPIDPAKASLAGKKIAHLTGTDRFKLPAAAITALQDFIKSGGTLIVDAAGGKTAFTEAAEKNLRAIFGNDADQLKDPLPPDNALYSKGGALEEVKYRTFARAVLGGSNKSPLLRGITRDGRLVCIYSREDLSVGLVGEPVDGILGYTPATATTLMRKILLLASGYTPVTPSVAVPPASHVHHAKPGTKPPAPAAR
jgi:hypothetical protein